MTDAGFIDASDFVPPTSGQANQVFGVNAAGSGGEYKSLVAGAGMTIGHSAGQITLVSSAGELDSLRLFNVIDYGAVGDGILNETDELQAAIDACEANGGGYVVLPAGTFNSDDLHVNVSCVKLRGYGAGDFSGDATEKFCTRIRKATNDGGTMLTFDPASTGQALRAVGVDGIFFDGNGGYAAVGLKALTCTQSVFRNLNFKGFTSYGFYPGITSNAVDAGQVKDTQNCVFENVSINNYAAGGVGIGLIDGSIAANVSYNVFRNLRIYTHDIEGILIKQGDNNVFEDVRCFGDGTAKSITLWLDGTLGVDGYVVNNTFVRVYAQKGSEQKGGATHNAWLEVDQSQGDTSPTITSGVATIVHSVYGGSLCTLPLAHLISTSENGLPLKLRNRNSAYTGGLEIQKTDGSNALYLQHRGTTAAIRPDTIDFLAGNIDLNIGCNYAANIKMTGAGALGLYGVTPVARQLVTTTASTTDIVTALQNLGAFRAS